MDGEREKILLKVCNEKLSTGGMTGLAKFVDSYNGAPEDGKYLLKLIEILTIRNNCAATRTYSLLGYSSLKHIIDDTHFLANNISRDNGGNYLKLKLEEYFFKIFHQEL